MNSISKDTLLLVLKSFETEIADLDCLTSTGRCFGKAMQKLRGKISVEEEIVILRCLADAGLL